MAWGDGVRGFTLIEVLVVMAIAALIVALVPPLVSAALPGARLKTAADEFASTLRLARTRAIGQGREVGVTLMPRTPGYRVDGGEAITFAAGIEVDLVPTPASARAFARTEDIPLRLYPDGSASAATIVLRGVGGAYAVKLDWLLGDVSVMPWEHEDG